MPFWFETHLNPVGLGNRETAQEQANQHRRRYIYITPTLTLALALYSIYNQIRTDMQFWLETHLNLFNICKSETNQEQPNQHRRGYISA